MLSNVTHGLRWAMAGALAMLSCTASCGAPPERKPAPIATDLAASSRIAVETYLSNLDPTRAMALRRVIPEAEAIIDSNGQLSADPARVKAFAQVIVASNGLAIKGGDDRFRLLKIGGLLPRVHTVPLGACTHYSWLILDSGLDRAALQESCDKNEVLLWEEAAGTVQKIQLPPSITVARGFDENGDLLIATYRGIDSDLSTSRWNPVEATLTKVSTENEQGYAYFNCANASRDVAGLFYIAGKTDGSGGRVVALRRGQRQQFNFSDASASQCFIAGTKGDPIIIFRSWRATKTGSRPTVDLKALHLTPQGFSEFTSVLLPTQDSIIVGATADGRRVYVEDHGFNADTSIREIYTLRLADGVRETIIRKVPFTGGVMTVASGAGGDADLSIAGEGMLVMSAPHGICARRMLTERVDHRPDGVAAFDPNERALNIYDNTCGIENFER